MPCLLSQTRTNFRLILTSKCAPFVTASPGDGGSRHLRAIIPIGAACLLLLCIVVFLLRHTIGRIVYHYLPNGAQGTHLASFLFLFFVWTTVSSNLHSLFHCRSSKTQRIYILGIGLCHLLLFQGTETRTWCIWTSLQRVSGRR